MLFFLKISLDSLQNRKKQYLEESTKILSASKRKKKLIQKLKKEKSDRVGQMDYPSRLKLLQKKFMKEKRKLVKKLLKGDPLFEIICF